MESGDDDKGFNPTWSGSWHHRVGGKGSTMAVTKERSGSGGGQGRASQIA